MPVTTIIPHTKKVNALSRTSDPRICFAWIGCRRRPLRLFRLEEDSFGILEIFLSTILNLESGTSYVNLQDCQSYDTVTC
mmetsp:Transcript_22484/g.46849  ORF Transcript_22484/g.46849 Transcript_22484/m.46849 type:complete len:80 (-) Transcript_22484:91-330(-)